MEDITYLLNLESLKRFKEEIEFIKAQVDEKTRQYLDVKGEYQYWYFKYVSLIKCASTKHALDQANEKVCEDDNEGNSEIDMIANDIVDIMDQINSNSLISHINPQYLNEHKAKLSEFKNFDGLQNLHTNLLQHKEVVKSIHKAIDNVEIIAETSTHQAVDYFVDELKEQNFNVVNN